MLTKENIQAQIEKFEQQHLEMIKAIFNEQGSLSPQISVLCYSHPKKQFTLALIPIPERLMENRGTKDILFDHVIPGAFKMLSDNLHTIICISWSSEVLLSFLPEGTTKIPETLDGLDKHEYLAITFECEAFTKTVHYEIQHTGKTVNPEGDLIDKVELGKELILDTRNNGKAMGKMSELFKKYNQVQNN